MNLDYVIWERFCKLWLLNYWRIVILPENWSCLSLLYLYACVKKREAHSFPIVCVIFMWQGYGRLPLILHVLHTKGVSVNYFICFLSIFVCYAIHQYFLFAVWTGSTSYARTQGQTLILRLCLLTTHVHLQMVLLHLHLSIFQLQQLQSLHPMHRLEHTVYDAHISFFLKRC